MAARPASRNEDAAFEKLLITELHPCRAVAEVATLSHALRAGAFKAPAIVASPPAPAPAPPTIEEYEEPRSGPPALAIGAAVVTVLLALIAIVVVRFFFLVPQ